VVGRTRVNAQWRWPASPGHPGQWALAVLESNSFGINPTSPGSFGGFIMWVLHGGEAQFSWRAEPLASIVPIQDLLGGGALSV